MLERKRVVLTGATGEVGSALAPALIKEGYELIVFSRDPDAARQKIVGASAYVRWSIEANDSGQQGNWQPYIDGAYGIINCAGANMFAKRYTPAYARICVESRILGTRALINAMQKASRKPVVFINSSSQGYYGIVDFDDRSLDENAPMGSDKWGTESAPIDAEAFKAVPLGVRVVSIRTGYVLDWQGGGLPRQIDQVKKGQGGATTPLNAWRSWIHIDDEVGLYLFALHDERVDGPLNGTAPNPITSAHFANALSLAVTGKPSSRKFPGFLLRLFMGPAADIVTHGKRIVPRKALDLGFKFTYPTIEEALPDLISKARTVR